MGEDDLTCAYMAGRGSRDAEIARLHAEVEALRNTLADRVLNETKLAGLTVDGTGLVLGLQGGAAALLAELLAGQFDDSGAINYLEVSFARGSTGENFTVLIQRVNGKTPAIRCMELSAEVEALRVDAERKDHALRALDSRLRMCADHSVMTYDAYDTFYKDLISRAIAGGGKE